MLDFSVSIVYNICELAMANKKVKTMNLWEVEKYCEYVVKEINTCDEELNSFLFSLGLYVGSPITVVNRFKNSVVVVIKDARYSFDKQLAEAIIV